MTERDPLYHPQFDALGPDTPYATADVAWPPLVSRQNVANGTPWQGGEGVESTQIIAWEVFPYAEDRGELSEDLKGLIDGTFIGGSQKAAAVLALSAYLAARVGWQVVPREEGNGIKTTN